MVCSIVFARGEEGVLVDRGSCCDEGWRREWAVERYRRDGSDSTGVTVLLNVR